MSETTPSSETISLYVKQPKVYPRETQGRFNRLRVIAAWVLLGLFYLLPWIQIGGQQIVLFDLPARQFHFFGLTLWPQDLFILALLLAMAAFSLFFFTALAGRLWCGYACPQTVWTEVFLWMERVIEGSRNQRIKLDNAPWSLKKLRIKTSKQAVWIAFALWTGFTFVGFFVPIRDLGLRLSHLDVGGWEAFWLLFYGFATYGNAGYLREQVCKYMCPYARFQSAMFDGDSLVISYDRERGEPRGGRRRDAHPGELGLGDCIDCEACVQVCPTGIDIRDGLQIECIACAACIDVCDEVMDKMNYPRGLVRYTNDNAMAGQPTRILRPRIFVYLAILLGLSALVGSILIGRDAVIGDVLRDRTALYRVVGEELENAYQLKLTNRASNAIVINVRSSGLPQLRVVEPQRSLSLAPGQTLDIPLTLALPLLSADPGMLPMTVIIEDEAGQVLRRIESRFFVPGRAHD